jgi:chaperonin GroEL
VIRVGAPSESEAKKLKEAFEDAISATKAAVAEGVLLGAGLALLRAIDAVDAEEAKAEENEKTDLRILKSALEAPTRQIAENSALDGGVVVDRMRSGKGNFGLDASNEPSLMMPGITVSFVFNEQRRLVVRTAPL